MEEPISPPFNPSPTTPETVKTGIRSLRQLIDLVSGRNIAMEESLGESGFAEQLPFPFMAMVGQTEMRIGLLLSLINPAVKGVLLIGPRGTGKTTAVRSLLELLPDVERSTCFYGCLPEDVESGGMDAICPDCAKKLAEGKPITRSDRVHLVELPLNAALEDVIGGLDDRAIAPSRLQLKRGLLAQADRNLLYVDEVNLLEDAIVNAILDAAAQGIYTVRRGHNSASYNSRFVLIGSMNPEEGFLRPQIMDRFGLRVIVRGLEETSLRLEAYKRVRAYLANPRQVIAQYAEETSFARQDILSARALLPSVTIPDALASKTIDFIKSLQIDSLRAEITTFEAARAFAAMEGRTEVIDEDIRIVAPLSLRLRKSNFMVEFFKNQGNEEEEIRSMLAHIFPPASHTNSSTE